MNVREPPGVGGPLGVAYVVAELARFSANIALSHDFISLTPAQGWIYTPPKVAQV